MYKTKILQCSFSGDFSLSLFFLVVNSIKFTILEFPGGPVAKDSASSLLWLRFDPQPGELPHATGKAKKTNMVNGTFNSSCVLRQNLCILISPSIK